MERPKHIRRCLPGANRCHRREVKIRCHDVRVDFCTRAYEVEISVKTLQSWMGNEDATMIMEVYAKLTKERKKSTRKG